MYQFLNGSKSERGCQLQMHLPLDGCGLSKQKQKTVLERANTHQLIILENPPTLGMESENTGNAGNGSKGSNKDKGDASSKSKGSEIVGN